MRSILCIISDYQTLPRRRLGFDSHWGPIRSDAGRPPNHDVNAQWAAKGGHDSLGMNEWSDWQYILFLRVVWPKKSFYDIFRAPVSSQTKLLRYFEFFV